MKFSKPAISISNQIDLLEKRGLTIEDRGKAEKYLSNISYYRLRAYMMPLQTDGDVEHFFIKGSTFEDVLQYYRFDRKLRVLLLDETERIEIAIRTQIIYQFCLAEGAWWYEKPELFVDNYRYSISLRKLDEEIDRSTEIFIEHYKNKYTNPKRPPAWMSMEVSSMGVLSKIYRNLKMSPPKKEVAAHFGLNPYLLESWMQSLTFVRNICAHHGRIYNRVLTLKPTYPDKPKHVWLTDMEFHHAKIYGFSSCLLYMLRLVIPDTSFAERFKKLVSDYPIIKPFQLGLSKSWKDEPLWNK